MVDLFIRSDGNYDGVPSATEQNTWHGGSDVTKLVGMKRGDVWVKAVTLTAPPSGGSGGGGFAANQNQILVLGDSRVAMDGIGPTQIVNGLVAKGHSASDIFVVGIYGARIDDAGGNSGNIVSNVPSLSGISSTGWTTDAVIDHLRGIGVDPRTVYLAFGTNNQLSASGGSATWQPEFAQLVAKVNSGPSANYSIIIETLAYGPGSDRAQYVDPFTTFLTSFATGYTNVTITSSYTAYLNAILASVGSTTYNTYWENANENIHNSNPLGWQTVRAPWIVSEILGVAPPIPVPVGGGSTGGSGLAAAQPQTMARRAKGSLDPWSRPVVYWEDYYQSGDSLFQTAARVPAASFPNGCVMSLPTGNFTWKDFSAGATATSGYGGIVSGTVRGFTGSGAGTHLYMIPYSSTAANKVRQQYTSSAKTTQNGGTTQLFQLYFSHVADPLIENLSLEYTDQPPFTASYTSPTRPHMWNGVMFASCTFTEVAPHINNVWSNAFGPGDATQNPGETFQLDQYNTTSGRLWIANTYFDGRVSAYAATIPGNTTSAGTKVTATHIGWNDVTSGIKTTNVTSAYSGYAHGMSCYAVSGTIEYTNVWSINNFDVAFNHEKAGSGTVTFTNCGQYGNGGERIILDSDVGQYTAVTINDHQWTTAGPNTYGPVTGTWPSGTPAIVRVDSTYNGSPNKQRMDNVTYKANGTVNRHLIGNDKNDAFGSTANKYYDQVTGV